MATIEVLQPRLRQLKLSGMVDSIAARVQEARARPLDPLDFLLLLLEDELMRRESESIDRYIHRAHFDEVCDLRDFDFAMRQHTLTQAEDLYELVKGRYRRGSLILTSNREPKDLYELFPTPVMAEGLLDRLLNSAYVITMLGRSYHPQQRPGRSSNRTSTSGGDPQVANYREQTTGNKR